MAKVKQSKTAKTKSSKSKQRAKPAASKRVKPTPAVGMDGWLVLWRQTMDDIPVGLFKTQAAAEKVAKKISIKECDRIAEQNDLSTTTHVCFFVCEFKAGKMVSARQIDRIDDA